MSIDDSESETKLIVAAAAEEELSAGAVTDDAPAAADTSPVVVDTAPAAVDTAPIVTADIDTTPAAADTAPVEVVIDTAQDDAPPADAAADDGLPEAKPRRKAKAEKADAEALPEKFAAVMPLVEGCKWAGLRVELSSWPPPDGADFIKRLNDVQRSNVFRRLPCRFAAAVFSELETVFQSELIAELTNTEIRRLLADLAPDDRIAFLDGLPAPVKHGLLNLLSPQDLKHTRELLSYPKDSVGRMMTPNFVYIKESRTAREAIGHIRRFGRDSETLDEICVTDAAGKLTGVIPLSRLVLAQPDEPVRSLMDGGVIALSAADTRKAAVKMIQKYNRLALPVVDAAGVLLGIVTADDLMDSAETAATEDFSKFAAVGPVENLKEASVWLLYKRRVVWLLLLAAVGLSASTGIAFFEDMIVNVPVLVLFLTLLLGVGGSSGAQSVALTARAIATGGVRMKDWGRMLGKELLVSSALGGVAAGAAAVLGFLTGGRELAPRLAMTVGLSMFMTVIAGSLIGMCLPFVLQKLKRDPAAASAPLIAAVSDAVGVLIYFSVAAAVLG